MIAYLFSKSAFGAAGIFIGCLIGLSARKKNLKDDFLIGGSVIATSIAAGGMALLVLMLINLIMLQFR